MWSRMCNAKAKPWKELLEFVTSRYCCGGLTPSHPWLGQESLGSGLPSWQHCPSGGGLPVSTRCGQLPLLPLGHCAGLALRPASSLAVQPPRAIPQKSPRPKARTQCPVPCTDQRHQTFCAGRQRLLHDQAWQQPLALSGLAADLSL